MYIWRTICLLIILWGVFWSILAGTNYFHVLMVFCLLDDYVHEIYDLAR